MNASIEDPAVGKVKPSLSRSEFDLLRLHIQQLSGIILDDTKVALMENRLHPLLKRFDCANYTDLYIKSQQTNEINAHICDAISTNETAFFRDAAVFRMIADHLIPHFLNRSNSLQIWSAAASTGQEAYSLAMVMHETIANIGKFNLRIEGTDISHDAIAYASYGAFSRFEVARGVDEQRLNRYFEVHGSGYRIRDQIRYLVHFRQLNLLRELPFGAEFDLILCRNVAIYFDRQETIRLFDRLANCLKPGGRVIVGSTETLWQVSNRFVRQDYNGVVYYGLNED